MRALIIMFLLIPVSAANAAEVAIDRILPPVSDLGAEWTSNRVVILVDPLSSPSEIADSRDVKDREASLRLLRDGMAKSHRNAQAFIRYYRGSSQYGVFVSRFDSKNSAEANWAEFLKEEKAASVPLPMPLGERYCFSNGMHNGLTFLRGQYCITVESGLTSGWEELEHLARAVDARILKLLPKDK
jgi:hypothetical protein